MTCLNTGHDGNRANVVCQPRSRSKHSSLGCLRPATTQCQPPFVVSPTRLGTQNMLVASRLCTLLACASRPCFCLGFQGHAQIDKIFYVKIRKLGNTSNPRIATPKCSVTDGYREDSPSVASSVLPPASASTIVGHSGCCNRLCQYK